MYRAAEGQIPVPAAVEAASADYRHQSDKLQLFIDDRLVSDPGHNLTGSSVYFEYQAWCVSNGYAAEGKSSFFEDLRRKGLLADSGTVDGRTARNVLLNVALHTGDTAF